MKQLSVAAVTKLRAHQSSSVCSLSLKKANKK